MVRYFPLKPSERGLGSPGRGARGRPPSPPQPDKRVRTHGVSGPRGHLEYLVRLPGSPSDELRVARAIVPNRCKNVPIRVMNVAGYPVVLPAGTVLADLEAVAMMEDILEQGRAEDAGRDTERERGGS